MIGSSAVLESVRRAIARVAPTNATVLVTGETGTGKELVARALHEQNPRRNRPFVAVSAVALTPGLVTSELFGHEAGSFTGAGRRRVGRFEQAQGGTLFLDEVGEMPAEAQAMLLRVIQERVIERVGGGPVPVDVRIVAATNRDLPAEVKAGRFRADLFYRLHVVPIAVAPLRDRPGDIAELATHFIRTFNQTHGRDVCRIPESALRSLRSHDWPGNVRELRNVVERGVILSDGDELTFDPAWLVTTTAADSSKVWAAQEKQRLLEALRAAGGRVYGPGGAAHRLGLNPTTLYGKMRKHGISKADSTKT